MTTLQINAAIAQACGWEHKTGFRWQNSEGLAFYEWDIPNYCNDLNAMHEAEKTLNTETLFINYYMELYNVTHETRWPVSATAHQRAEAFLRSLNKWDQATDKKSLSVGGATTEQSSADHVRDATKMMEVQK